MADWVSIHALLAERDVWAEECRKWEHLFQFTRSSRSATGRSLYYQDAKLVSIHALLAERDRTPGRTR